MSQFNVHQVFHVILVPQALNQNHTAGKKKIFMWSFVFINHVINFIFYDSRYDRDAVPDKYGDQQIENEFYVNKNILRPTRKTRDQIEILSTLKYRELPKRYSGE